MVRLCELCPGLVRSHLPIPDPSVANPGEVHDTFQNRNLALPKQRDSPKCVATETKEKLCCQSDLSGCLYSSGEEAGQMVLEAGNGDWAGTNKNIFPMCRSKNSRD